MTDAFLTALDAVFGWMSLEEQWAAFGFCGVLLLGCQVVALRLSRISDD